MFQKFRHHWRRYRPYGRRHHHYDNQPYKYRDRSIDAQHVVAPVDVPFVCDSTDFFDCGEERIAAVLQRRPEVRDLDRHIDTLRARFARTQDAQDGFVALLAQAPRAVLAQIQMDKFPHGYRNKQERLYELIDFNDTLVATILVMDEPRRQAFAVRAKQAADRVCRRVGAPCFTDEQWTAIVRGLTLEIAVYLAAKENGFNAFMTDRAHDALGIDLQIQDPETGYYINIDVKTPSSFRHRMEQLVHEGRLTERELLQGDHQSYIIERNGHEQFQAEIVVLCILPDLFGDLADWRFVDTRPMREKLNQLIREHGQADGQYGKTLRRLP